jgi:hypothetical protein
MKSRGTVSTRSRGRDAYDLLHTRVTAGGFSPARTDAIGNCARPLQASATASFGSCWPAIRSCVGWHVRRAWPTPCEPYSDLLVAPSLRVRPCQRISPMPSSTEIVVARRRFRDRKGGRPRCQPDALPPGPWAKRRRVATIAMSASHLNPVGMGQIESRLDIGTPRLASLLFAVALVCAALRRRCLSGDYT